MERPNVQIVLLENILHSPNQFHVEYALQESIPLFLGRLNVLIVPQELTLQLKDQLHVLHVQQESLHLKDQHFVPIVLQENTQFSDQFNVLIV
jgi:hypothetical protein